MSERELDYALVKRVQAGEKAAFDLLVRKYQSRIISLVSRMVKDQMEVEDVAQEAFIRLIVVWQIFAEIVLFIHGYIGLR